MTPAKALFAKQPIFDQNLKVVAYELLFRNGSENEARITDADLATSQVLFHAFGRHRIQDLIGSAPAYINFTGQLLASPPPLPPSQMVIEILEDVTPNDQVLNGIQKLKALGYQIALDDFFINPSTRMMLSLADIIKIDVLSLDSQELHYQLKFLRPYKFKLLAEKIETYEMLEQCKQLGFDLFQGYFLAKPDIVKDAKVPGERRAMCATLAEMLRQGLDEAALATILARVPRLTERLLNVVNSTLVTANEIGSVAQAVALLGLDYVRNWGILLLLADTSHKPLELTVMALTRAKFGEQIGLNIAGRRLADACFTLGLLSTIDAYVDLPMARLVEDLGLDAERREALLARQGLTGAILRLTEAFEQASWAQVEATLTSEAFNFLDEQQLNHLYGEAIGWAHRTVHLL